MKQAADSRELQAGLRLSEAAARRDRALFDDSPVAIWEHDFTAVRRQFDDWRAAGVVDLEAHLRDHPGEAERCAAAARVVDVNRAAVAMLGAASKAELMARYAEVFAPESFDAFRRGLVVLWQGGTSLTTDGVFMTLTGERREVTVHLSVAPGCELTFTRVLTSIIDVTEQRRAVRAMQESERRYREVFECTSDIMYMLEVTSDGRFRNLAVNPAFERSIGLTAAQVVGKCQEETVGPETAALVNAKYRRCVEAGTAVDEHAVLELPTGRRSFHSTLVPVRDERGRIYRLIGVSRDVTVQEQAHAEIEDLYNHAPCGYHSLDAEGTFVRVNDTELQWLGYSRDDLVFRRRFVELLTSASAEAFGRALEVFADTGVVRDLELELVRKGGAVLPVMLSASGVRDRSGRLAMTRATLIDLTARRKVEAQLQQAQKLEAVGRLAGGVAHDFNNILSVILMAASDILDNLGSTHPVRDEALEIEAAAKRATALTRQLLAFSRRQQIEPRACDLDQIIASLDKMLRRIIGEDVELRIVSDGAPHLVQADPGQLEQVLLNLAINARDAMPSGGRLDVELRALGVSNGAVSVFGLPPRDHVVMAVTDTGTGMGPEVVAHLFEPFFTTKDVGKGTGLGLSTVYGIVKQSGGEVRVDTVAGRGSTFMIFLPALGVEATSVIADRPAGYLPRGSETVLVAEDEPQVRGLVVRCLRGLGYTVLEAADGVEAMHLVAGGASFDLLASDAIMPHMGGTDLAERVRAVRPATRVLFFSGYTPDGAPLPSGPGMAFLQKPFTPALLARKVRELLDGRD